MWLGVARHEPSVPKLVVRPLAKVMSSCARSAVVVP
jgi:hypothetical protein